MIKIYRGIAGIVGYEYNGKVYPFGDYDLPYEDICKEIPSEMYAYYTENYPEDFKIDFPEGLLDSNLIATYTPEDGIKYV